MLFRLIMLGDFFKFIIMRMNIRGYSLQNAKSIIMDSLSDGPALSKKVEEAVTNAGLSSGTYRKARKELGLVSFVDNRLWYIATPEQVGMVG